MENLYSCDLNLRIEPAYYSGGVPVFKPTMKEFQDFYKFNKAINKYGMKSGIVKIVPPEGWKNELYKSYNNELFESIRIKNPIVQHINGVSSGVYVQQNIERARTYNIYQWKNLSLKSNYQPPIPRKQRNSIRKTNSRSPKELEGKVANNLKEEAYSDAFIDTSEFSEERCNSLEATYWKSLTYAEPMYGADLAGSLFSDSIRSWNVAHLPNLLDLMDTKLPGVNDAYLYAGLWKATFAWHLEDQDLYSINYLHFGAPKQWYSIPQEDEKKFFELMKDIYGEEFKKCSEFLRHKTFLVSPQFLERHDIKCNKIIHNEGEFMITYPYGYHAGFNYGYNLAESVNFALDDWFSIGEKTKKCECISDSVGINVKQLYCSYKGIPYEAEPLEGEQDEDEEELQPENRVHTNFKLKLPQRVNQKEPTYQCTLCPNNVCSKLLKTNVFELLQTDEVIKGKDQPYMVHKLCALVFPSQLSVKENAPVRGLKDITTAQRNLKCSICSVQLLKNKKLSHGVCFQCTSPSCVRSFHASCALGSGMTLDFKKNEFLCKYHRKKDTDLPDEERSKILEKLNKNSFVQFSFARGSSKSKQIFTGVVATNNPNESTLELNVYPSLKERVEVHYEDILLIENESPEDSFFLCFKRGKPQNRSKKVHSGDLSNDLTVTGIKQNNNIHFQRDDKFVTEILQLNDIAPHANSIISGSIFWYNLPLCSTDQVARYTDNIRSSTPNDNNFKKYVQRKGFKENYEGAFGRERHYPYINYPSYYMPHPTKKMKPNLPAKGSFSMGPKIYDYSKSKHFDPFTFSLHNTKRNEMDISNT